MRTRRERLARIVVSSAWLGGLGLALRLGISASDPSAVVGLLVSIYLGLWGLAFFLHPNATTANAARFLMVTLAIGLAIAAFEVPALLGRVDYRDIFHTPTAAWRRHNHKPDPDLIYVREANVRERHRFVGCELAGISGVGEHLIYESDVRYDAQGFRNPVALDRADVVVVGDSFVEGLHVRDDELMTARIAAITGRSVANLGRSGDGPQQERLVLERFGLPKRPKVVVWVFYEGNDLEDAAEYEANRAAVAALGPVSRSRVLYERSFARNALMYARRAWIAPTKSRPVSRFRAMLGSRGREEVSMLFAGEDYHRGLDEVKLAKTVASIREAAALCDRAGAQLLVAFVPTKLRVYRELCRFPTDSEPARWPAGNLPARVRDEVERMGSVRFLDLAPVLRDAAAQGNRPYFADDTHWTAEGHDVAAGEVARAINAGRLESFGAARPRPTLPR